MKLRVQRGVYVFFSLNTCVCVIFVRCEDSNKAASVLSIQTRLPFFFYLPILYLCFVWSLCFVFSIDSSFPLHFPVLQTSKRRWLSPLLKNRLSLFTTRAVCIQSPVPPLTHFHRQAADVSAAHFARLELPVCISHVFATGGRRLLWSSEFGGGYADVT